MKKLIRAAMSVVLLLASLWIFSSAFASGQVVAEDSVTVSSEGDAVAAGESGTADRTSSSERGLRLVASFTVFLLAVFVGFEVITKVPPTLHTPLMSGSNAISGITVVGALLTAGHANGGFGSFLGLIALLLAFINVMGGFLVTHRMLMMFKKR